MSRVRQAQVRFYFDADILGLARVLVGLRSEEDGPFIYAATRTSFRPIALD